MKPMTDERPILLDTHTWIWLAGGSKEISQTVCAQIEKAAKTSEVLIASISVWELAMLERKGRVVLSKPVWDWVHEALLAPGIRLVPLSAEIALASCFLPGRIHDDPADRFIIATAREQNALIASRDRRIIEYGQQGYIDILKC